MFSLSKRKSSWSQLAQYVLTFRNLKTFRSFSQPYSQYWRQLSALHWFKLAAITDVIVKDNFCASFYLAGKYSAPALSSLSKCFWMKSFSSQ